MMTVYWDELFLKLHNERILHEELDAAQSAEDWMTFTVEEAIQGLNDGALTLADDQKLCFQRVMAFDNQLGLSLPQSFIPETRAEQNNSQGDHFTVQDKANGIMFGIRETRHEIEHSQVEVYQQQMIEQMLRLQAQMKLIDHNIFHLPEGPVGCQESLFLLSPIPYYQIAFVRAWRGKAYVGSCQFKLVEAPLWVPLTYAILHTATWSVPE
jgi:hypothetical protein